MFDWIFENWGLLCIWFGILANAAGLIYSVCKLLRRGGLRRLEEWIALREAARRFECEAEAFTAFTGAEKLQYVLYRLREYMTERGVSFEESELIAAVEADIAFSNEVNAMKSETLE